MSDNQFGNSMHQAGRDARDTIGTAATDAGDAVRDAARKAYGTAGDLGQQALERGNRYGKSAMQQIEHQPLTAVLVAAAVGFAAGLLLGRR